MLGDVDLLAGAAEEILGKLVTEAGGRSTLASLQDAAVQMHQHLFGEPGDAKCIADRANRARNSLKHLTTDAGREVTFDPAAEAADLLDRAEVAAAFKAATTKAAEPMPKAPSVPGAREMISLRIDRDVLEYFQEDGPGWQERINAALRTAAGK